MEKRLSNDAAVPTLALSQVAVQLRLARSGWGKAPNGIVKLLKTRLTDPQDDGLVSCREPGMLGVGHLAFRQLIRNSGCSVGKRCESDVKTELP